MKMKNILHPTCSYSAVCIFYSVISFAKRRQGVHDKLMVNVAENPLHETRVNGGA